MWQQWPQLKEGSLQTGSSIKAHNAIGLGWYGGRIHNATACACTLDGAVYRTKWATWPSDQRLCRETRFISTTRNSESIRSSSNMSRSTGNTLISYFMCNTLMCFYFGAVKYLFWSIWRHFCIVNISTVHSWFCLQGLFLHFRVMLIQNINSEK